MKDKGKVFISYSNKDKSFVDKFVNDLLSNNIFVWYDKLDLKAGDSIPIKIIKAINKAKYFIVVLSPDSVRSPWVNEELNVAFMKQITSNGTFLIPVLIKECMLPLLLSHRKFIDFRNSYISGLKEILEVFEKDFETSVKLKDKQLYPWPDIEILNSEFVYINSIRFDKFFRMNCNLNWTSGFTTEHIVKTLSLPLSKEIPELGLRWSFSYSLVHKDKVILPFKKLKDVNVDIGSILRLLINDTYEDLYEKKLNEMWDGTKFYESMELMFREKELRTAIEKRGKLDSQKLEEMSNSFFFHV